MNKTIKKIFSLSVLMIVVALIFTGCTNGKENQEAKVKSEESPKELTKVTVSEFRGVKYAPVHVAYQNGYYEDEGLDIEFAVYGDGPVAFQGMHAGDSQFCLLSIDPVFRAFDEGLESKLIAAVDTTRLYGFAGSKDITDISQLKGKSVFAGAPGSAPYSFVWSLLENAGLNPEEDITFVQMDYGASIAALDQGTIDASYMDHYNKRKFEEIGANILVDGEDAETRKEIFGSEKFEASIITATKEFVDENPEIVQKFVNGTLKGCQWVQEHSDKEVAEVLAPLYDGTPMETLIEKVELSRLAFSPDCLISEEGYNAMEKFCLKTGVLKKEIGYENIVDMSFLKKANKSN